MSSQQWESLEQWSPTLFIIAGTLLVVFAGFTWVNEFTGMAYPDLENTFGPGGFAIAFVGLLGLYPTLADRAPWLARTGAVFAAIGAVGAAINSVGRLASFVGIVSDTPGWVAVLGLTIAIGMLLGYLLFSAASLRAGVHSRTVGLLLLAPLAIFAIMLSGIADMVVSHSLALVVLASGQAVAHLAIGAALRNGSVPTDRAEPMPDTTVR